MELPVNFIQDMKDLLACDYQAYVESYKQPRWYGLRVNTNKISVEDFMKITPFTLSKIPWIENGFYYDGEVYKPGKHPYYFAGLYYLQEPSAMTPANHLAIETGDKVLDLCAAPGGKTTELGAKLKGQGVIVSNDISNSRARVLLKNQELLGLHNIYVMSENPEKMVPVFEEYFDKILIDAPCSGEGMFRKDHKMVKSWELEGPDYYAKIQKTLITQGAKMLKPGGLLLYSTCTFNQEENEGTIAHLLGEDPQFKLVKQKEYEGFRPGIQGPYPYEELNRCIRIWPQHMKGEGHFLALLQKNSTSNCERSEKPTKKKKLKIAPELLEFWNLLSWPLEPERLHFFEEKVYYLPKIQIETKNLRLLRNGLLLGELKKHGFEPSQALAMTLKSTEFTQCLDFKADDIRVVKYLKGETLDVEDLIDRKSKGWYLITVDGFSLGFAKLANQTLKNKYAIGWRIQS